MDDHLEHHGVKGMKWGVRKDVASGVANISREASSVASRAASNTKRNKKVKDMSDDELRKRINRMEMEQRYSQLNPSKVSRGAERTANVLSTIGSIAAIGASVATIAIAIKDSKKSS